MNITDKFVTVLLVVIASSIVVGGACALTYARSGEFRFANTTEADIDSAEAVDATTAAVPATPTVIPAPTEAPAEVPAATAEGANESAPVEEFAEFAEANAEADTETAETTVLTANDKFIKTNSNINELAYKDNITAEEVADLKNYITSQPQINEEGIRAFFNEYGDLFTFYQDEDGNYLFLVNEESLQQNDIKRHRAAMDAGLVSYKIEDAAAFPYEFTDEQTGKLTKLKVGQKADFSEKERDDLVIQEFQTLFGAPWLLESDFRLISDQKISSDFKVGDYYMAAKEFLGRYDDARNSIDINKDGVNDGADIWLTKKVNKDDPSKYYYFTTMEYLKYPIAWWYFLYGTDTEVARYTVSAKNHYCLDICDFNSMRQLQPAKYAEDQPANWHILHTKQGKIALRFGHNCYDKRPMVYNYTAVYKPKPKSNPVPPVVTYQLPQLPVITETVITTPSTPSTPSTPGTPDPTPTPTSTPSQEEIKSPKVEPKIPVGGGQKSDPGSGEKKEDQGNGKGEYQQGTSENPGNKDQHPSGPPSDSTDNGTAPTKPIEGHDSGTESGSAGGKGGGAAGDNGKKITVPD